MTDPGMTDPLLAMSRNLAHLASSAAAAVVGVRSHGRGLMSGFFWKPGVVVTANDPLEADDDIVVIGSDGRTAVAEFKGRDQTTDIALLRVDDSPSGPTVPPTGRTPEIGHLVVAVGRQSEGPIANLGMVSVTGGRWQSLRGGSIDSLIRLDMRLNPHSEGGLVVDAEGRAVGMPVFGPRRRALVIPMATIERVAAQLLADGRVRRGYLGVGLHPVQIDEALSKSHGVADRRGLIVISVDPDGPARGAGVAVGDVFVGIDGAAVPSIRSLSQRLGPDSVARTAELSIVRAGQLVTVRLAIGESPSP